MKALTYTTAHNLENFNLVLEDIPNPQILDFDLLVEIKAISINPVDYKIRSSRSSTNGEPIIIGWDASGIVKEVGPKVQNFKIGDEVYYAGDLTRAGSYAELQAVDSRLVGKKPSTLTFAQAAALPLTSLTAYEALLDKKFDLGENSKVLIIGGAGGVGSMAIQLLKTKTKAQVIVTASRGETRTWTKNLGADIIIDHTKDLSEELKRHGIKEVDVVFGTTHSDKYLAIIPNLLKPFGHFVLIDDPQSLDIISFKRKALSVHWELMFTKSLYHHLLDSQGIILNEVAQLVDAGKVKTTLVKTLKGLTSANLKEAHTIVEKGISLGKIVVEL